MSQQINLYDPALLRKREWVSLTNLVLVTVSLALGAATEADATAQNTAGAGIDNVAELTVVRDGKEQEIAALKKEKDAASQLRLSAISKELADTRSRAAAIRRHRALRREGRDPRRARPPRRARRAWWRSRPASCWRSTAATSRSAWPRTSRWRWR